MDGLVCDVCQKTLLLDSSTRYIVEVRGYAAYDPLELTRADLERDLDKEMREVVAELARKDPVEAEEEIHKEFRFDLCPECWKRYARDPLNGLRGS